MQGEQIPYLQPVKLPVGKRAFSRIDLLAVILVVLVLGVWAGVTHSGEYARMARCAGNLSVLGKTMHEYADDNGGALPAAGIDVGKTQASWDSKVFPYLKAGVAPRFLFCPSDTARRQAVPRSYAMGGNDMLPEKWPPGSESATGVGLWWDKRTVLLLVDEDALEKPELLPAVKLLDVPVPTDTVLLTESIDPNNIMSSTLKTSVLGTSQQRQFFKDGGASFHHGEFNYLMVDGHVEPLSPLQTGSFDGTAGIWSLKKED